MIANLPTSRLPPRLVCSTAAVVLFALGCASPSRPARGGDGAAEQGGELMVFAAASLTNAFNDIARDFEKANPLVEVTLSFAGSQSLRTQIEQGAPAHVFASANAKHLAALRQGGLVDDPVTFARNEMVIVVPAKNPAGITSFADLPGAERLVLAGSNVPAGAYAEKVLENAGEILGRDFFDRVMKRVVSRELHVRQTLQKVVLGEADAAMVYATDAAAAGDRVRAIAIPEEFNVVASYPIATVKSAGNSLLGQRFVEFVRSEVGRRKLQDFGFRAQLPKGLALTPQ